MKSLSIYNPEGLLAWMGSTIVVAPTVAQKTSEVPVHCLSQFFC